MSFKKLFFFSANLLLAVATKGESGMRGVVGFDQDEGRQLEGTETSAVVAPAGRSVMEYSDSYYKSECACRRYLVDDYLWYKVEEILVFPHFCCFLSVLAYYSDYQKKANENNVLTENMSEQEAIDKFLDNVVATSAMNKNQSEAELMLEIDRSFSDELGLPEYGYDPKYGKCVGKKGVYLLKCLLLEKLHEGIEACYCEYRANFGCSYRESCDKDIYFDIKIASKKNDPYFSCFQCPEKLDYDAKSVGYKSYIYGKPYDRCLGYCFLVGSYHDGCK